MNNVKRAYAIQTRTGYICEEVEDGVRVGTTTTNNIFDAKVYYDYAVCRDVALMVADFDYFDVEVVGIESKVIF